MSYGTLRKYQYFFRMDCRKVHEKEAMEVGRVIDEFNCTRKDLDHSITEEALQLIEENDELLKRKTTVLYQPYWHKGVIGIVASRLIETYYRPTVILTESHGKATGSARSVIGFNLYNAIEACSDLLEGFGGHMYAAGLTLKVENIPEFMERFERIVAESITPELLIPQIDIDALISFSKITPKFYRILKQLEPFGPNNMKPVFVTRNVKDVGTSRLVGKNYDHLKLDMVDNSITKNQFSGIAFQQGHYYEKIKSGKPFTVCYTIEENTFKGSTNLQLMIKDIRV